MRIRVQHINEDAPSVYDVVWVEIEANEPVEVVSGEVRIIDPEERAIHEDRS